MRSLPLDFQRRCERRWTARFSQQAETIAAQKRAPEKENEEIAEPDERNKDSALG